jgi:hypothetical protein
MDLHEHYDQLTVDERAVVDNVLGLMASAARNQLHFPLDNRDAAERAADVLAIWILGSRPSNKPNAFNRISDTLPIRNGETVTVDGGTVSP